MKRKITDQQSCAGATIHLVCPATLNAETVLSELFELLEEYGPAWYTVEHHGRACSVLQRCQPRAASVS